MPFDFSPLDSTTESSDILLIFHSSPRPVHEMISGIGFLRSLHRHTRNGSKTKPSTGDDYHVSHDLLEGGVEGRYISVCQDASLFIWKNNLTLQRTISVKFFNHVDAIVGNVLALSLFPPFHHFPSPPLQLESAKLTWVTGMAVMPNVNKLMLSFTDNMLSLYDLSSAHCDRLFQIVSLPHCVLAMDYWYTDSF